MRGKNSGIDNSGAGFFLLSFFYPCSPVVNTCLPESFLRQLHIHEVFVHEVSGFVEVFVERTLILGSLLFEKNSDMYKGLEMRDEVRKDSRS